MIKTLNRNKTIHKYTCNMVGGRRSLNKLEKILMRERMWRRLEELI